LDLSSGQQSKSKINTKNVSLSTKASAMTVPVAWPEPYRKWVGWTEEKKQEHGSGNQKDLGRFCMEEWSLISKLIREHSYLAVILAKGPCN